MQITQVKDPVDAVRELIPSKRGADVVMEAVGRTEAWEWAVNMVRKGGTVNFFGGCATGTKVQLDTNEASLLRDHAEGDIPPHARDRSPGVWVDY